jgi:hypothetical protein
VANKRIFYACHQVGVAECGTNSFTSVHGLQQVTVNTKFGLEPVFEVGQIELYENSETIPSVEVTAEKVLDGYPLIYHLATKGATSASLSGRSNRRATVGLSIYSDVQDAASGTPIRQCTISGVYVSALEYTFQTNGPSKESVTLVGNNKVWSNTFTAAAFSNTDSPAAAEGVNRREDVLFGESSTSGVCRLPTDIPGVSASGYNPYNSTTQEFGAHVQSIKVSTNLGREELLELGRRGPYHRYATFPVEVSCDIEVTSTDGDLVTAIEESEANLSNRTILIRTREGTVLDLGSKNKLDSVTFGGATAGQNGGNATCTFAYKNFNSLKVVAPHDPSGLS